MAARGGDGGAQPVNREPTARRKLRLESLAFGRVGGYQRRILPASAAEAGATLSARVKNTIGVTVTTSVEAPGTIERSMGKMRRIVDHRPR